MKPVVAKTLLLFLLVQLLALGIGLQFASQQISVVTDPANTDNSFFFFLSVLFFAALLLIILKYYAGKLLFLVLELGMEFFAFQLLLSMFTSDANAFVFAGALITSRLILPQLQQLLLLVTVAIVGGLLGASLDLLPAALLAALLSGYDVVAVFYTKHMVTLAKNLSKRGAAFSVNVKAGKSSLQLGTGDLVIPAMVIVSANKTGTVALAHFGYTLLLPSLMALVFALIGFALLLVYIEKKKGYWPALPPVAFGAILGALIGTLL
ncbi:hypothetical protein HY571_00185 [Candidatus Micrarchaeota archaeon]|nr:hypothetical protein [Candidatus Micrarchaeota archaeon]